MEARTMKVMPEAKAWGFWEGVVEGLALVITAPLLPFAALARGFHRLEQSSKTAAIRREYELSRHQLELASRVPGDFLALYLKRLKDLRQRYQSTSWASEEEAEQGYKLLLAAEAALLAEAQAVIQNIPGTREKQEGL